MAYLLSNIIAKNYRNRTTIVEIIVDGRVVSFFETQCIPVYPLFALSFPQIDIIAAMVVVWRVTGKIIRSVLCNIVRWRPSPPSQKGGGAPQIFGPCLLFLAVLV